MLSPYIPYIPYIPRILVVVMQIYDNTDDLVTYIHDRSRELPRPFFRRPNIHMPIHTHVHLYIKFSNKSRCGRPVIEHNVSHKYSITEVANPVIAGSAPGSDEEYKAIWNIVYNHLNAAICAAEGELGYKLVPNYTCFPSIRRKGLSPGVPILGVTVGLYKAEDVIDRASDPQAAAGQADQI